MNKHDLKSLIVQKLQALGIAPVIDSGADLTVDWEFMDEKWSSGKKKIEYHNSAYLDEQEQVLYYWESSKETGSGFSFGGESETFSQSGMTLKRKIKSIQYGPDGKAYEYSLDLGQITEAYKDTAKQNGWAFKLVLKKDKGSFPPGYVPVASPSTVPPTDPQSLSFCSHCGAKLAQGTMFCSSCGTAVATAPTVGVSQQAPQAGGPYQAPPVAPAPEASFQPTGKPMKNKSEPSQSKLPWLPFAAGVILYLAFFGLGNASIIGWIIGAVIVVAAFLLQRKFAAKGCLITIVLWIVAIFLLFIVFAVTTPGQGETVKSPSGNTSTEGTAQTAQKADGASVLYGSYFELAKSPSESIVIKFDPSRNKMDEILKTDDSVLNVRYHQGWLYFIRNNHIFRMKPDGSSSVQLTTGDAYVTKFEVGDSGIIFSWDNTNASDNIFAKAAYMKHAGSAARVVYDGIPDQLWAEPDGFYFITMEAVDHRSIYNISKDGQTFKKLDSGAAATLWLDGEYIYYTNIDDQYKLYRIKKDGSGKEPALNVGVKYQKISPTAPFKIYKNYVYYLGFEKGNEDKLLRMKLDGSDQSVVVDEIIRYFQLDNDRIVYSTFTSLSSVGLDGKDKREYLNKNSVEFSFVK